VHDEEIVVPSWYRRALALGSEGADVELVQRKLNVATSGVFGVSTEAKVRGFQTHHGLPVTGVIDEETADLLGESIRKGLVPDWYKRDLSLGDHGDDVRSLGEALGIGDPGDRFGKVIEMVLRRFQASHPDLELTGRMTEKDAIALSDDVPWSQVLQ
jgi:hypothetical protein